MARISDVASAAGVSIATVSRVLSDKPYVRPHIRARVLAAIQQLDYQPSRVARSLRLQRSQVFGLIIPDIQNPFFTELARAVEDVAYGYQHAVFLCNTDEDATKERLYVELMEAEQVAGVIIAATQEEDSPCRLLLEAGIPVVAVDRRLPGLNVDTVLLDNHGSAYALVRHLIQAGHTRIAGIFGLPGTTTGRERYAGYVDALKDAGIRLRAKDVRRGPYTEEVGERLTAELLSQPNPPRALFAANNLLGAGALAAIHARGLHLPEDLAFATFGETSWMRLVQPAPTVVRLPIYDMGRTAATLLHQRMSQPDAPPHEVVLPGTLVIGGSSHLPAPGASPQKGALNG